MEINLAVSSKIENVYTIIQQIHWSGAYQTAIQPLVDFKIKLILLDQHFCMLKKYTHNIEEKYQSVIHVIRLRTVP